MGVASPDEATSVEDAHSPESRGVDRERDAADERERRRKKRRGRDDEARDAVAWDWSAARAHFDAPPPSAMDELARVRREAASVVAANSHVWGAMRRFENDDAYLVTLSADAADDRNLDQLRVRATRRGRAFRDAWEEADFLAAENRAATTNGKPCKKRPFAGCEGVASYRQLVWGYDDALFEKFLTRLEARRARANDDDCNGDVADEKATRIHESPARKSKKAAKRRLLDADTLPAVPADSLHPASCGAWKLTGKEYPGSEAIHPASIRSPLSTHRWIEERALEVGITQEEEVVQAPRRSCRHDVKQQEDPGTDDAANGKQEPTPYSEQILSDEATELPSFGVTIEEDEVSREINNSLVRLVEVSALNWRRSQSLYERAVSFIQISPLLQAEAAAAARLEQLYKKLYPPGWSADDPECQIEREVTLARRPRDILEFAAKPCPSNFEAVAVAASVEYALRLKKGEPIDVLDRNGCWNEGVVNDLYLEGGVQVKNVLVSFSLWSGVVGEWVSVIEGRILPRGVADGRASFTLGPTRVRKRIVELNKSVADLLQSTYPSRQNAQAAILQHCSEHEDEEVAIRPTSKKQRKR